MFKKKDYKDVAELVRVADSNPAFAADLDRHLAERKLVRHLFALRCARGLTQKDVAEKMGCKQAKISKLESSRDDDISLGDIRAYAKALGLATFFGLESGPQAVGRIKYHAGCIRLQVHKLARVGQTDPTIAEGVAKFFDEAALTFLKMLEDGTKALPAKAQQFGVSVEIIGPDCGEGPPGSGDVEDVEPPKSKGKRGSRNVKDEPIEIG